MSTKDNQATERSIEPTERTEWIIKQATAALHNIKEHKLAAELYSFRKLQQQNADLLSACKMMLALDGGNIAKDYREEFDSLKAAIAAAEGRKS